MPGSICVENKDGTMLLDKPIGVTSHDVVNFLRRQLDIKRIGHTGTLDPNATGLLVMLLGRGTLLSSHLIGMPKRYIARFAFGAETDTFDVKGQVVDSADPGQLSRSEFEALLENYKGEIEQLIPAFSAAKRDGKTLHKMARRGNSLTTAHKLVEIKNITIIEYPWPEVVLDITCSSGCYIRSLAHEMGQRLGFGGYLQALRRIEVGPFRLSEAFSIDEVIRAEKPEEFIRPLRDAMPDCPVVHIKPQFCGAVSGGRPLVKQYIEEGNYRGEGDTLSLLVDPEERVLALARLNMQWRSIERLAPQDVLGAYVRVIDEGNLRTK